MCWFSWLRFDTVLVDVIYGVISQIAFQVIFH